ncbi:unnamed protein product [Eruca vesicaria subsp. sativa]|uniref:Uncharacterized protein n=1 Tax=Eruca vesicaria subsp. sativa TaxID=29727 RepID=A0ABC8LJJ4_ERUVS|nr:unnamed protein product [Eruca vesicaria subsp. sativa]
MVCWTWSWKPTLYVIIMHTLILSSCIAAFLYIKHTKIPLDRHQYIWGLLVLLIVYFNMACTSVVITWVCERVCDRDSYSDSDSSDHPNERKPLGAFFLAECLSHGFGLALLVFLLYIISPKLALCVGIPAAVYFIVATVCVCNCVFLCISA